MSGVAIPASPAKYAQRCISRMWLWLDLYRVGFPPRRAWVYAGEIAEVLR